MKVLRIVRSGHSRARRGCAAASSHAVRGTAHALEHARAAVLERNVEIGQHASLAPSAESRHRRADTDRRSAGAPRRRARRAPRARSMKRVSYVWPRHSRLAVPMSTPYALVSCEMTSSSFTPARASLSRLAQHLVDRPARERPRIDGDDAEAALVVAALGDLQIRVVARREPDALRRHQIEERIVLRRQVLVHRAHHFLIGVRAGDLQHARMPLEDALAAARRGSR